MRVFVTMIRTSLPMIRPAIDVSSMTGRARALFLSLLACGPLAAGAQTIPADAEPACHAMQIDRTITLSGRYALDYGDESIGSDVWFEEDDASARRLPARSQRAGVIVFTNQHEARRGLRLPAVQPRGVCRFDGRATLVIRDLETACPGLETPDRARLVKVVAADVPSRHACAAAAR
ncbi:hypothetical protein BCCR75502_03702 [Burkholderia sola]|nr:hypothetical protein BCCR75389_03687 [Burkholderia cenocepacia]CAG2312961.1 hypothetical protein BCCR75384_03702 [Burkholderia cenocepacia]CAG2313033.1 hypothetical protein BCCR75386_03703 [Burkholderia cenocepacia]CAG2313055.1 hypothetical protein BCCR12632_03705 [Burkholderia cenocepacia]CAG2313056.1 hypothetical protein BCCR75387_03702 [Burkholderia cenocepacia]